MAESEQASKDKLTISIVTTSWYAKTDEVNKAASFFEESGFNVRIKTRGVDKKEEKEKYDISSVFKKIKGSYLESRPKSTEDEQVESQKAFERDYSNYSASFTEMKKRDGKSTDVEDKRLQELGNNEFAPLKDYLEDAYQKSQILKGEVEAAARGEVDVIWPVEGGGGAPEMLSFLPDKLLENPAVIVGMSDIGHVQNALIQSTDHSMKGIQDVGSWVFGDKSWTDKYKDRIPELFSTIRKTRKGQDVDAEYKLVVRARAENNNLTTPQLVNLSGGTLNVLNRANEYDKPLSEDPNSDTVIVEMHAQAQSVAGVLGEKGDKFDKIFGNKKNIILGNVLFDKESNEFQKFTDMAVGKGINVYEGLPFGHGNHDKYPKRPIPLNVPCVLLPGSSEKEATLLVNPSKEKVQEKLKEIGYEYTPAKFSETLKDSPEQARDFITSEPEIAAVMIKYSDLKPEKIFEMLKTNGCEVDEGVQNKITEKIAQGAGEPNKKKKSSTPIQFPERIIREIQKKDSEMQKELKLGKKNLKQTPPKFMKMSDQDKLELSKISQLLKEQGTTRNSDDNTRSSSNVTTSTEQQKHIYPQSGKNL